MRLRTRILLVLELLLGVLPLSFFYIYYFPVAIFWTRRVLELVAGGIGNLYTSGVAVEYFLSAADRSGRRETLPRVAPDGFYSFEVDSRTD